ncbi:tetrapyrrole methylase family protein/MazG family protein/ATP diphosphatase [Alkalispirillum mobile]|uniref:Nucleoside triphosphate pyrophosphohydrolase n=1 Tax=Alkalispirillum mobile TaxID=85925 RepID=A0A498CBD6_9GAMM|nr:nucleoside triphosphate pyrophosphohydrolase [Alkalispirillum mobile]RLK50410.1 tetrapyrrole methylase family protein/MazG family protein/ATP diphosphatase [Alkalispirillum mobile]
MEQVHRLLGIMAALRDPDGGCPWDLAQTFATIAPYTLEEAYEVAEAIRRGDMADLQDELGDLLLQVVFHARMAEEEGFFTFDDVARSISDKLIRRHPHVFGEGDADDAESVRRSWEAIKAEERAAKGEAEHESVLDGITSGLPGLVRARKLQSRAARVGFDWDDPAGPLEKVREEVEELAGEMVEAAEPARLEDELGDLMFAVVNLARHLGVDPETAVQKAGDKFEGRFRHLEEALGAEHDDLSSLGLDRLEAGWQAAKSAERKPQ